MDENNVGIFIIILGFVLMIICATYTINNFFIDIGFMLTGLLIGIGIILVDKKEDKKNGKV